MALKDRPAGGVGGRYGTVPGTQCRDSNSCGRSRRVKENFIKKGALAQNLKESHSLQRERKGKGALGSGQTMCKTEEPVRGPVRH